MYKVVLLAPYDPRPPEREGAGRKHGGVERVVWNLGKALARQGWDVSIIASGDRPQQIRIDGVRLVVRPRLAEVRRTPLFPWLGEIAGASVDVVHTQGTYPFLSDGAALFAKATGTPCVISYQFDAVGRSASEARLVDLYYRTLGSLHRCYDRVIFSSREYSAASRIARGLRSERVRVVPNGVDPSLFRPKSGVAKRRQILFVGRLAPYKGLPVLLAAFERIARESQEWSLVVVGDGELRGLVGSWIRDRGPRVQWRSRATDEELVDLYNASAVTVLPSTDAQEAFGLAVIESLACGTPVVTSDLPGVRELASLGGAVVPPGDADALAEALLRVGEESWTSEERRRRSGETVRRFSWDEVARQTAEVYRELL